MKWQQYRDNLNHVRGRNDARRGIAFTSDISKEVCNKRIKHQMAREIRAYEKSLEL